MMMVNKVTRPNNAKTSLIVHLQNIQKEKKIAPCEVGMPAMKARMQKNYNDDFNETVKGEVSWCNGSIVARLYAKYRNGAS